MAALSVPGASTINDAIRSLEEDKNLIKERYHLAFQDVYFFTNESNLLHEEIAKIPLKKNSVCFGVSGTFNYDIICLRKPEKYAIFDINPRNKEMHETVFKVIRESSNRFEFINKIKECKELFQKKGLGLLQQLGATDPIKLEEMVKDKYNWLGSDKNFEFIKRYITEDRIILTTLDIVEDEKFKKIRDIISESGLNVDMIYTSNILQWLSPGFSRGVNDKEKYGKSLKYLSDLNEHVYVLSSIYDDKGMIQILTKTS
jgi:hypothetical protein